MNVGWCVFLFVRNVNCGLKQKSSQCGCTQLKFMIQPWAIIIMKQQQWTQSFGKASGIACVSDPPWCNTTWHTSVIKEGSDQSLHEWSMRLLVQPASWRCSVRLLVQPASFDTDLKNISVYHPPTPLMTSSRSFNGHSIICSLAGSFNSLLDWKT